MDQSGGLSALLGGIGTLACQEISLLCGVMDEVRLLKQELERLQGLLQDLDSRRRPGDATTTTLVGQIRDSIEDAENAIQVAEYLKRLNEGGLMGTVMRYACLLPRGVITRHRIGVKIRHISKKISGIKEHMQRLGFSAAASILAVDGRDMNRTKDEDENDVMFVPRLLQDGMTVVGFQDDYNHIVARLLDKESKITAISIVAMGGAGKTTIARRIYTAPEITRHFDVTLWVSLPKEFKTTDVLRDIYKQITDSRNDVTEIGHIKGSNVRVKIYEILVQNRYLLVLDDVWETNTWNEIINEAVAIRGRFVSVFPDANNGSRVMLTTRNHDVATKIIGMQSHVHILKLMDDDTARELLMGTALSSHTRPENSSNDLDEIGRVLAKKCGGLPLALAVLGKYLAMNLNTNAWRDTLKDWRTVAEITGGQMVNDILARSYSDLPNYHLKSCFLYVPGFPKNSVIAVSDLIRLWIAESFIPHTTKRSPEEEARRYVSQLAQRSLVQVVNRSTAHRWIEEIRIHDILGDWCKEEARHDGFLDIIDETTHQDPNTQQDGAAPSKISVQSFHVERNLQRRKKLRTFLNFNSPLMPLPKLRYLRVLHIEDSSLEDFCKSIVRFIHLRYLCLRRCQGVKLSPTIGQLLYLQTIDLRGTKLPSESGVPYSLWDIPDLRHVYLEGKVASPRNGQQKELQTLHLDMINSLGKFIWEDALKCWVKMTLLTNLALWITPIHVDVLKMLAHMPRLIEIVLYRFNVVDKLPECQSFPQGLRRLLLFANVLKQDPMPILENLPSLVVLELQGYEGKGMSCSAKGFPELQVLMLVQFCIEEWLIDNEAMPRLSHLTLERVEMLSMPRLSHLTLERVEMTRPWKETKLLPQGLLNLRALEELKLVKMPWISLGDPTYKDLENKPCKVILLND